MCGICGIIEFQGADISRALLKSMTNSLAHRGPDGEGFYLCTARTRDGVLAKVGLGHRRLKIIDLTNAASQPMSNEDDSIWIVFNGEIYNYGKLQTDLKARGHLFKSRSDTEVILHLYEEKGEACLNEIEGMFAFALWDKRENKLFLARDRAGQKPLYYFRSNSLFAFASEIKALLCHPMISPRVLPDSINHYLSFGYPPYPKTMLEDVYQVPPGNYMSVMATGEIRIHEYWDLTFPQFQGRGEEHIDLNVAAAGVRQLVSEAVEKRLIADVPLGVFLSGGIDSTIILGVMSKILDNPVRTFSIGFAGCPEFDERPYARVASDLFKTKHTEFVVEPNAIDLIETLVWHHDGPFGDSSAIPTYIISQLAREHVTVALNGDGGDELFAGYPRFITGLVSERCPPYLGKTIDSLLSCLPVPDNYNNVLRRAHRFLHSTTIPLPMRFIRWNNFSPDDLDRLLNNDLAKSDGCLREESWFGDIINQVQTYSALSQLLYINFKTYLPNDLLIKMDRCTMAHSLEARSPFLDQRLADYVAMLPGKLKLHHGQTKYILKEAFSDLVPAAIIKRRKMGFSVPVGAWLRNGLRQYLLDVLLSPDAQIKGYLDIPYLKHLIMEHLDGQRDHGHRLWMILTFEVWLRMLKHGFVNPKTEFMNSIRDVVVN